MGARGLPQDLQRFADTGIGVGGDGDAFLKTRERARRLRGFQHQRAGHITGIGHLAPVADAHGLHALLEGETGRVGFPRLLHQFELVGVGVEHGQETHPHHRRGEGGFSDGKSVGASHGQGREGAGLDAGFPPDAEPPENLREKRGKPHAPFQAALAVPTCLSGRGAEGAFSKCKNQRRIGFAPPPESIS